MARMNSRRRRARLRQLIARDAIIRCWLCGKEIDRSLDGQHDLALSVDHVTPLADGGDHSLENLKAAHRVCNTVRGRARLEAA